MGMTTGQMGLDGYNTRNGYTPGYARQTTVTYGLELVQIVSYTRTMLSHPSSSSGSSPSMSAK
jgi:hypothetical protein